MPNGYMGKILFVDLSKKEIREEIPGESLYRQYVGGYGIGARILYDRQKGGVDPLGPDSLLGLLPGVLTGTPAPFGCRYAVVAKSPLTNEWGDSNSGGDFGPRVKHAGYDGVFFSGISDTPVYLIIDNGSARIMDAVHLWGKDTAAVNNILKTAHGKKASVVCIGEAGEKQSLLAGIISHGGVAGRAGLGAVMGSKRLKAVVALGSQKVPLADKKKAEALRKAHIDQLKSMPFLESFHKYGTGGHADSSAQSGDSPVKNWGGVGVIDLPDVSGLSGDRVIAGVVKRTGCWRCPVACRAMLKEKNGSYGYPEGARRPEYETLAAFGAMVLNNDADVVASANDLCNRYGQDTISTGTVIAFAMECYEHGIITTADTDGIELTWGNGPAIINMTRKMGMREGFGAILADGVQAAAAKIGKGADQYAVHIGGQELGLHDPKFDSPIYAGKPMTAMYKMDATPGRHTTGFGPTQFSGYVLSAAGYCMHGTIAMPDSDIKLLNYLNAVTGWDLTMEEMLETGERIANIRHAFNLREGNNPLQRYVHPRIFGNPPQKEGPLAGISCNIDAQQYWNLGALDWDMTTTKPSRKKLKALGLSDVSKDIYPETAS